MKLIRILKFIKQAKHPHFIYTEKDIYFKWKWLIKLYISLNKNYKSCEIFRKKYKLMEDFVVIGLKYSGKNVKRRTSGFAKEFVEENRNSRCIYCGIPLNDENATADHIVPISKGGNNTQVNMVVCCKDCNLERGNLEFKTYIKMKTPKYNNIKYIFI